MGMRTERLREVQAEADRGPPPLTRATESQGRAKAPWPMAAIIFRSIGLAFLLPAAAFAIISLFAREAGSERVLAVCWDLAFWTGLAGGFFSLVSLIVRMTVRGQEGR